MTGTRLKGLARWAGRAGLSLVVAGFVLAASLLLAVRLQPGGGGERGVVGYRWMVVLSDSMKPTFRAGDLIVVGPVAAGRVQTGDVITFRDPDRGGRLVTHRVKEVVGPAASPVFRTRGDANTVADARLVPAGDVVGHYACRVPYVGHAVQRVRSPGGLFWLIVVPGAILLILEVAALARTLRSSRRQVGGTSLR